MPEALDLSKMKPILEKFREQEGALIPVLQEAQGIYGYLPEEVLDHISRELKIPLSRIYGVVTFYAQFYLAPRGRHTVRVCRGTACHVRGGARVLDYLENRLEVKAGGTTKDMLFTLESVNCLGACALGPMLMIDQQYHGRVNANRIESILEKYVLGS
jgi:NADH-quinone oxidoreductase subunit E